MKTGGRGDKEEEEDGSSKLQDLHVNMDLGRMRGLVGGSRWKCHVTDCNGIR